MRFDGSEKEENQGGENENYQKRMLEFLLPKKRETKIKHWYLIAMEIFAFYMSGFLAQTMNDDPFARIRGISTNFFTCVWSALTIQPTGLVLLLSINAIGLLFYYYKLKNLDGEDLGYEISAKNTYGSAAFLTKEETHEWGDLIHFEKELKPDELGDVLGRHIDTGELIIRNAKKGDNRNIAVYGSPGAGKSVGIVRVLALQTLRRQESIIFNDPKGEMANSLADMYKNAGYNVRIFNLVTPSLSDSWNPLYGLEDDKDFVPILADIIMEGTKKGKGSPQEGTELVLLRAAIYYVIEQYPEEDHTLEKVHNLLSANSAKGITHLFEAISDPSSFAVKEYRGYNKSSPNFSGNVITGVCSRISLFATSLKNITKTNDIDMTLPGKQKCAYFIVMPDQTRAYDFIAAMFYTTAINRLVKFADAQGVNERGENLPLPVGVQLMLDEAPNTGKIPDFEKKISTIRSRGISATLIMQGISQLQRTYDNMAWSSILNCCDVEIVLRTNEPETLKYISEKTGEASIHVETKGNVPDQTRNSDGRRRVMTTDEVRRLKKDEMILIPSGMNVLKCKKYTFLEHPDRNKVQPYAHTVYHIPEWRKPQIRAEIRSKGEASPYGMDAEGNVYWKSQKERILPKNKNLQEMQDGIRTKDFESGWKDTDLGVSDQLSEQLKEWKYSEKKRRGDQMAAGNVSQKKEEEWIPPNQLGYGPIEPESPQPMTPKVKESRREGLDTSNAVMPESKEPRREKEEPEVSNRKEEKKVTDKKRKPKNKPKEISPPIPVERKLKEVTSNGQEGLFRGKMESVEEEEEIFDSQPIEEEEEMFDLMN